MKLLSTYFIAQFLKYQKKYFRISMGQKCQKVPILSLLAIFPQIFHASPNDWNFHQTWQTFCSKTYPHIKLIVSFLRSQGSSEDQFCMTFWQFWQTLSILYCLIHGKTVKKILKLTMVVDIYNTYLSFPKF